MSKSQLKLRCGLYKLIEGRTCRDRGALLELEPVEQGQTPYTVPLEVRWVMQGGARWAMVQLLEYPKQ